MSQRDVILQSLRSKQHFDDETNKQRYKRAKDRLMRAQRGILPKRSKGDIEQRTQCFIEQAEASFAELMQIDNKDQIEGAIISYLKAQNLPLSLRHGKHAFFQGIAWSDHGELQRLNGASKGQDIVGLSIADFGIAESGSLALTSGKDNPTTLNFLPDHHIVILQKQNIVSHYEDVWQNYRKKYGYANLPRAVNFITGPSRSADIEQTLLLGAHGPRKLFIILLAS